MSVQNIFPITCLFYKVFKAFLDQNGVLSVVFADFESTGISYYVVPFVPMLWGKVGDFLYDTWLVKRKTPLTVMFIKTRPPYFFHFYYAFIAFANNKNYYIKLFWISLSTKNSYCPQVFSPYAQRFFSCKCFIVFLAKR